MEGIAANKFELPLGEGNSLPEFEDIVIGMTPGESKESELTFPADFINDKLAGQTVSMQVTLHAIKVRDLPEVNDDFAELAGGYTSVQDLKDAIEKSYVSTRKQLVKGDAQKKLLDGIKAEVSFELPQSIVRRADRQADRTSCRASWSVRARALIPWAALPPSCAKRTAPRPEDVVKSSLVLLAIANAENLTVDPQEVDMVLQKMAASTGQDFHSIKDYYEQHNLMIPLKDRVSGRQGHGTHLRKRHGDHGSPGSSPERIVSWGPGLTRPLFFSGKSAFNLAGNVQVKAGDPRLSRTQPLTPCPGSLFFKSLVSVPIFVF